MATYICLGTPPDALASLVKSTRARRTVQWTVHSQAQKSDVVLFYLLRPISALVAKGVVSRDAVKITSRRDPWFGHSMAPIGQMELLPREISRGQLRKAFPQWGYWTQPRVSARVPDATVPNLWRLVRQVSVDSRLLPDVDDVAAAREGGKQWVMHLRRERSVTLRNAKRSAVLQATGRLECEACRIDFGRTYGDLGVGFCEVHHDRPLGSGGVRNTKSKELRILCSNCHRMIHRTNPMIAVSALRRIIRTKA